VSAQQASHPERRLRFDGTITAGNLLTVLGMVAALLIWGLRLESRVDQQDLLRLQLEKRLDSSEAGQAVAAGEIKAQIRDVASKLDRLIERLSPPVGPRER
jgi:hypothetical protein